MVVSRVELGDSCVWSWVFSGAGLAGACSCDTENCGAATNAVTTNISSSAFTIPSPVRIGAGSSVRTVHLLDLRRRVRVQERQRKQDSRFLPIPLVVNNESE